MVFFRFLIEGHDAFTPYDITDRRITHIVELAFAGKSCY
jgi:hypothetical protein